MRILSFLDPHRILEEPQESFKISLQALSPYYAALMQHRFIFLGWAFLNEELLLAFLAFGSILSLGACDVMYMGS